MFPKILKMIDESGNVICDELRISGMLNESQATYTAYGSGLYGNSVIVKKDDGFYTGTYMGKKVKLVETMLLCD